MHHTAHVHLTDLPERENDYSCPHEKSCKHHKHGVSSLAPLGVVEYLCTLCDRERSKPQVFYLSFFFKEYFIVSSEVSVGMFTIDINKVTLYENVYRNVSYYGTDQEQLDS